MTSGTPLGRSSGVTNRDVGDALARVGDLLETQNGNPFRVRAYRRAADYVRGLDRPLWEILREEGTEGLEALPTIGTTLARAVATLLRTGRLPMLERLEGEVCPEVLFRTVPGIGPEMAHRISEHLGIETLEELEIAAHDGRLESVPGFGPRRAQSVRETLAGMLGRASRLRGTASRARAAEPPAIGHHGSAPLPARALSVDDLLAVDREYRELAGRDALVRIAPRRFNPDRERWLPILHTSVGERDVTALYSNTAMAHRLGRTHDWVVIYVDGDGASERYTVVTERSGEASGLRVVRGREAESLEYYRQLKAG